MRKKNFENCQNKIQEIFEHEQLVWTQDDTYMEAVNAMSIPKRLKYSTNSAKDQQNGSKPAFNDILRYIRQNYDEASALVILGVMAYRQVNNWPYRFSYSINDGLAKSRKSYALYSTIGVVVVPVAQAFAGGKNACRLSLPLSLANAVITNEAVA